MARTLDSHEFTDQRGKHDWDSWLNGEIWELERGTDFTSKPGSLRAAATKQANNRKMSLRFETLENGNVVLQAVPSV